MSQRFAEMRGRFDQSVAGVAGQELIVGLLNTRSIEPSNSRVGHRVMARSTAGGRALRRGEGPAAPDLGG